MSKATGQPATTEGEERADGVTLAALQSQINDLKEQLAALEKRPPIDGRVDQLEAALQSIADLFADMSLNCFRSDRRGDIRRVGEIAGAVREHKEG